MRVLVTGREGQLARCLVEAAGSGVEAVALGRPELDITDMSTVAAAIATHRPDVVVNAAAYTAVDKAEDDPEQAMLVNGVGAGLVAKAAADAGLPVIHVSTDYVFDGRATRPWREDDPTAPLGVYGTSKLAGEQAVAKANPRHIIMRTAWVHSPHGANFLKTMLRLAADRPKLRVVADQSGTPTHAGDLATAILVAARQMVARPEDANSRGVFHVVNEGSTNWAGFASEIFARSRELGGPFAEVEPITSAEYPTRAARPAWSVLDTGRFRRIFNHTLPHWTDGTRRSVAALVGKG